MLYRKDHLTLIGAYYNTVITYIHENSLIKPQLTRICHILVMNVN